jgi:sortase (surface protein transpeptidase)
MPSIGVYRAVQTVGINAAGEIDVPASNVGLWNGGAQPGQNGVVFLDGHVFGVFANLKNTPVGSEFSLTWGGVVYRYRVANNQTYSLDYLRQTSNGVWASMLYTPVGGPKGLNIMTCAGSPQGNTYSHRTVVYAYQI